MGSNLHGGPVSPWPRRTRRLLRGCTLGIATLALTLVAIIASLVATKPLRPSSGLFVGWLALGITTVVLLSLRLRRHDGPRIGAHRHRGLRHIGRHGRERRHRRRGLHRHVRDLVACGPHSAEAIDWLEHHFAAVTRGNHEDAALTWLEDKLEGSGEHPYGWLRRIEPSAYRRWRDAFARMPLAITVETRHGPVGIVHAESPQES